MIGHRIHVAILSATLSCSLNTNACEGLSLSDAWVREPPPRAKVAAAYFSLKNNSAEEITVTHLEASCCSNVEIHQTEQIGDRMHMRQLDGIWLKPGQNRTFSPGAAHLMLFNLGTTPSPQMPIEIRFHCRRGNPIAHNFQ